MMQIHLLIGLMLSLSPLGTANSAGPGSHHGEDAGHITFQQVLDLTLKNSLKIALADEQVDSAARALRSAKRRRLPRVSVQGWFSGDLLHTDQWGSNNIASYLALDWDFYQDGAIMQLVAQSWANFASALLTWRRTVSEEIFTATSLFYDALKAKRHVEIAEQTVKLDELQLDILRSEFLRGRRSRSELRDAEARDFESRLALTRAKQDFQKALLNLRQLTRHETIETVQDFPREITWTLDFPVEHAIKIALSNQPNVLIARANLELARLGVKYAKLKRWPSVRFLTGTDYAFAPLARPEEFGFRAGVILSYPLYDAGDRKSRIEDAKSAVKLTQIQLWQAQYQMEQDVTDSYVAASNQLALLHLAEKRHQKVKTDFAIAQEQFKQETMDEMEMARTRLQFSLSVQRIETLRLEALLARARLLKSLGVSSMDRINAYSNKEAVKKK